MPFGRAKRLVTKKNARWNGMADVKDHRREAIYEMSLMYCEIRVFRR